MADKLPMLAMVLFAVEGTLAQYIGSINGFANNLYATNLGATDAQIGLVQMVPNLVAVLLMLPLGVLADRARSAKTVPLTVLCVMAVGFLVMGFVPQMGAIHMPMFFFALAFTVGGPALYNAQWQSFFGEVMPIEQRNQVLTVRNRCMFIIAVGAPILCGVLASMQSGVEGKLFVLQSFYWICAAVALLQALVIARIPTPVRDGGRSDFSMRDVGAAIRTLAKDRSFLGFFIPVVFFYMTWQIDWSMWYIGQVQYLHFTEADLSISSGVFNIGQLISIGLLAKAVRRYGPDRTLTSASVGLIFCPLIMITCTLLPQALRPAGFTVMLTVLNATQCATNLCVVQILLRVAPKENRTLAVSLYTLTTTLTNCFMPSLGVALYTAAGADLQALYIFNLFTLVIRVIAFAMLILRCRNIPRNVDELAAHS